MVNTPTLIGQAYSAFNQRNVGGALALMSDNVSWPKASEVVAWLGKNRFVPTGPGSGRSLILMWNRWK